MLQQTRSKATSRSTAVKTWQQEYFREADCTLRLSHWNLMECNPKLPVLRARIGPSEKHKTPARKRSESSSSSWSPLTCFTDADPQETRSGGNPNSNLLTRRFDHSRATRVRDGHVLAMFWLSNPSRPSPLASRIADLPLTRCTTVNLVNLLPARQPPCAA